MFLIFGCANIIVLFSLFCQISVYLTQIIRNQNGENQLGPGIWSWLILPGNAQLLGRLIPLITPWIHTCLPRNDSASCRSHTSFVQEVLLGAEARNLPLIQIFWTAPTTNTNTDKNKDTNIFSAILLDRLLPQHSVRNLIIITGFRNLIIITGLRRLRSVASRALRQIHAGELNLDQPSVALINVPTIRGWCELVSRW